MKNIKFPIAFATIYVVVYHISPFIGIPQNMIVAMFLFAPIVTIWMVLRILKDGEHSGLKFEEGYLYEDMPKFDPPH